MHLDIQNSVSSELICALSWNSHRILKGEDHLTSRQYVDTTTTTTATATFTSSTIVPITTSTATTCKVKSIDMKISRSIWIYRLSKEQINNIIAMANCIKLNSYTTIVTTITTIPKDMKVKFSENISESFCCTEVLVTTCHSYTGCQKGISVIS